MPAIFAGPHLTANCHPDRGLQPEWRDLLFVSNPRFGCRAIIMIVSVCPGAPSHGHSVVPASFFSGRKYSAGINTKTKNEA